MIFLEEIVISESSDCILHSCLLKEFSVRRKAKMNSIKSPNFTRNHSFSYEKNITLLHLSLLIISNFGANNFQRDI